MTASSLHRAFGTCDVIDTNKVRARGCDDHNRTVDQVFRVYGFNIQVGVTGPSGGRAWRELRAGEWADYPEWLTGSVPQLLGLPLPEPS